MRTEFNTDTEALKQIAEMLLALAVLADRACLAIEPVRWFVLFLLRPAVTRARAIVADVTRLPGCNPDFDVLRRADGAAEATSLAHEFRTLAAALYEYLCWCAWAMSQGADDDGGSNIIRSKGGTLACRCTNSVLAPARVWRLRIDDS